MKNKGAIIALLVIVFLTMVISIDANCYSIFDGTFNNSDWTHHVIWDETPGGGFYSASQISAGGNPGSFQGISHIAGPGFAVYGHMFGAGGSYDPALGAIDNIHFSFDGIVSSLTYVDSTMVAAGLLIKQNNQYFVGKCLEISFGSGWISGNLYLKDQDFVGINSSGFINAFPDFSTSGVPLNLDTLAEFRPDIHPIIMTLGSIITV